MNIVSRCLRIWEPLPPAYWTALPMLAFLETKMKLQRPTTLPVPVFTSKASSRDNMQIQK